MSFFPLNPHPIEAKLAREQGALALAFTGDAVYSLAVRAYVTARAAERPSALHRAASALVNAGAQAALIRTKMDLLTESERDIFLRGRNAHSGSIAKHADVMDYKYATGLEALIDYHYLCGNSARLDELFSPDTEEKTPASQS